MSVQWIIQLNVTDADYDVFNLVRPTSGTLLFEQGQKDVNVSIDIIKNETPEEAKSLIFR